MSDTRGVSLSDMAPVIEDLNPLFNNIMTSIRNNQIVKPRMRTNLPSRGDTERELEKYQDILVPFGKFPLQYYHLLTWTAPLRKKISAKVHLWGKQLSHLADRIGR